MTWWKRLFGQARRRSLAGQHDRVAFTVYSKDGKRAAEVREFSDGKTYLLERESAGGSAFADRYAGKLVGPFASPEAAESFIVATAWFNGE